MNKKDPKLTALLFNECINNQDIEGLCNLMSKDHKLTVREGKTEKGKDVNRKGWKSFFKSFPEYKNYFHRIESKENLVILLGYAFWSVSEPYDPAIWTAIIINDLVSEWRIYQDTLENRVMFNLK
jgi:hypothetical protein